MHATYYHCHTQINREDLTELSLSEDAIKHLPEKRRNVIKNFIQ